MRRRLGAAGAAAAFTLAACGPGLVPAAGAAGLDTFDSCDALLQRLHDVGARHVGPYGWDTPTYYGDTVGDAEADVGLDRAAPLPAKAPDTAGQVAPAQGAPEASGTNVQEIGVDEADAVKAEPGRILVLDAGELRYVDASGGMPRLRGKVAVDGTDMFVHGDRVLVVGTGGAVVEPQPADAVVAPAASSVLTEVDVSDPDRPVVARTLEADGSVVGSRMHDGTVRLVLTSEPRIGVVSPGNGGDTSRRSAIETNRRIVAESGVDDWLPRLRAADGTERNVDCDRVMVPEAYAGIGMLAVLTVDLTRPIEFGAAATLVSEGSDIYMSPATLYVTTAASATGRSDGRDTTAIHAFDVTGEEPARYLASGEVRGTLYDQWAMSEHDGVLRVASTASTARNGEVSSVTVLRRDGDDLVEVGRVDGLGPTEEIKAVRMAGDVGYVVTFRRTDPLYVVDLHDPARPVVSGELKIPGFSEYLHPVGDGRLIGVGQDADEATGRTRGLQVSLFDVSDPAAPHRLGTWSGGSGATSPVESDHHAFLYWEPAGTIVLPVQAHGMTGGAEPRPVTPGADVAEAPAMIAPAATDFVVLRSGGDTLTEAGRIAAVAGDGWARPGAARSVVVGDVLYTIDGAGIGANRVDTLERVGEARFG